ncbi:FecCD family ABC transporter permease [Arthrobacter woluwensis]|uniref:Iron complex transport system permease protein n=1 Tax=Arthrobacter woluwensis TaxID=156980 RepID=A0A1H4P9H5_9MICC|nr:iron ABC transporter permease [Arthrobacter woluwensis]SEC04101.1 iron complex transport system permease protein [Arthrobacter woluwensis]
MSSPAVPGLRSFPEDHGGRTHYDSPTLTAPADGGTTGTSPQRAAPGGDQGPGTAPASTGRTGGRRARALLTAAVLCAALVLVILISSSLGQFSTSPGQVLDSLRRVALGGADPLADRLDATLWTIRFPRTVLALLVGACLAVAGTVMQGLFANPLAEPSIIGVSAGASVGASLVIVAGAAVTLPWTLPAAAFAGALLVTALVWSLSRTGGRAVVLALVLTGIAINAVAGAATSFLVFLGDTSSREQIIFWQMGTLSNATWQSAGITAAVFLAGLLGCLAIRGKIDVLALGDRSASAMGIPVERLRLLAILLVCVLTGVAVAFAGVISFVGLIVPHTLRLVVGPSQRYLVPLSALGGAVLLGLADIAARTVIPFADLPVGVFTALVGGPLFLVLLRRTLRGSGVQA